MRASRTKWRPIQPSLSACHAQKAFMPISNLLRRFHWDAPFGTQALGPPSHASGNV